MELELVDSVPAPEPVAPTPAPEATPSPAPQEETPVVETPAPVVEPVTPPVEETPAVVDPAPSQLFKLPDGREVDAAGLQREYENLLPEFTRKSQRLAELERGTQPQPINKEEPAWKDPNYQPKDWAEAIEIAKQVALDEMRGEQQAAQAAEAETRNQVEAQLTAVKALDPKVDENALFEHAVKFGFNNLTHAHANMKAIAEAVVSAEQRTLKNLQNRANDPVATIPTPAPVANANEYAPVNPASFRGALDFLDSLKSQ